MKCKMQTRYCLKTNRTMKVVDVVVICISSPVLVGIYHKDELIETIAKDEKISDILPVLFEELMAKYTIDSATYTNSPGSFLGIKLTYIFLKTLSLTQDIKIYALSGFHFNNNAPIKAYMGKYFIKQKDGKITISDIPINEQKSEFTLPKILNKTILSTDIDPIYVSPAVY